MDTQVKLSSQKSDLKAIEIHTKDQMNIMVQNVNNLQTQVIRFAQKISQGKLINNSLILIYLSIVYLF